MMHEMIAAFDLADADDDVRAVIVTGSGRAFCAGADLSSGGETFAAAAATSRPTPACRATAAAWSRCGSSSRTSR
jgi:enoyl-CoA hydratase/carnithine racemase